jgi:hypothetical protein
LAHIQHGAHSYLLGARNGAATAAPKATVELGAAQGHGAVKQEPDLASDVKHKGEGTALKEEAMQIG